MRGGTLKRKSLIFERKTLGSRGRHSGVFEMNQDPLSSEQNDRRQPQRDQARKQMRLAFAGGSTHDEDEVIVAT